MALQQYLLAVLKPRSDTRSVQRSDPATSKIRTKYVGAAVQVKYPILYSRWLKLHALQPRVLSELSSDDLPRPARERSVQQHIHRKIHCQMQRYSETCAIQEPYFAPDVASKDLSHAGVQSFGARGSWPRQLYLLYRTFFSAR